MIENHIENVHRKIRKITLQLMLKLVKKKKKIECKTAGIIFSS